MSDEATKEQIPTMIFEVGERGLLVPRLPEGPDGTLEADGIKFLTPAQCALNYGGSVEAWREQWIEVWGKYLRDPGASFAGPSAAGAIGASSDMSNQRAAVAAAAAAAGWDIVRVVKFPHLNNAQWAIVCRECLRRRIDPMDIWIILEKNEDTQEIEPKIITTIKVFRMVGDRTGLRGGESAPEFCGQDGLWTSGPWVKEEHPLAARVYITRKDSDEAYEGVAYWKFCARLTRDAQDRVVLDEFWEKGGPHMLGKCAAANAYRLAFPEELGGFYTSDEMRVPRRPDREPAIEAAADEPAHAPADVASMIVQPNPNDANIMPDDVRIAEKLIDDTTPELARLPIELVFNGPCASVEEGMKFIERCARLWPRLYRGHAQAFAAAVMKLARDKAAQSAAA